LIGARSKPLGLYCRISGGGGKDTKRLLDDLKEEENGTLVDLKEFEEKFERKEDEEEEEEEV
jgi:hypothetical protein